jgi:hypothetical protein
MNYTNNY